MIGRILILFTFSHLSAQSTEMQIVDSAVIDTLQNNIHKEVIHQPDNHKKVRSTFLQLSTSRLEFTGADESIDKRMISFSMKPNEKLNTNFSIDLNSSDQESTAYVQGSIIYSSDRQGLGLTIGSSNGILAPKFLTRMNYYQFLNDRLVINSTFGRIHLLNNINIWPLNIGLTYITNQYGLSLGLGQELSNFNKAIPTIKLGLTHESTKGDVFNVYILTGSITSPENRFQFSNTTQKQLGCGGWFRKKATSFLSVLGSIGYQRIDGEANTIQLIGYNIALSIKLQ